MMHFTESQMTFIQDIVVLDHITNQTGNSFGFRSDYSTWTHRLDDVEQLYEAYRSYREVDEQDPTHVDSFCQTVFQS